MPSFTTFLYILCFFLLIGLAAFIYRRNPTSRLHQTFALGALALQGWLLTLFLLDRQTNPSTLLWLGRLNFASVVVAVWLSYRFVQEVADRPVRNARLLLGETLGLFAVTLFTPLVDQAEFLDAGRPVAVYGPLFPLYVIHVVAYSAASVAAAFREARRAKREQRGQLLLIGGGICATAVVALTTNALLPYAFGDFRFSDVGALSTIFFLGAVAYAIFAHHLFDIRIFLRKTLAYGLLLALVLALYSSLVLIATQYLTPSSVDQANPWIQAGVLVIAFAFDPLRRWLEEKTDHLLFHRERERDELLGELARTLARTVSLDEVLERTLDAIAGALQPRRTAIVVFEEGAGSRSLQVRKVREIGFASPARLLSPELETIARWIARFPGAVSIEDLREDAAQNASVERRVGLRRLSALDIALAVPLSLGRDVAGLLLVGESMSGGRYTLADRDFLEAIGGQVMLALQRGRFAQEAPTLPQESVASQ